MEAKLISLALLEAGMVAIIESTELLICWLSSITRSAPSKDLACVFISLCKLSLKELIATNAAIPKIMEEVKRINLDLYLRLSLQAIFASHENFILLKVF